MTAPPAMIAQNIQLILVVTGALTAGIVGVFLAPDTVLRWIFGEIGLDAANRTVARHWGLLVATLGVLLVYAAFHAEARLPIMAAAVVEKGSIAALVLASSLRNRPVATAIAIADLSVGVVYLLFLAGL